MVLLAFAEVDGDDNDGSSRLVRAVEAASTHTSEADFILVADGFELDAMTREVVENALGKEGWRTFSAIELPEFEGFSSAVNRAMRIVPGDSVVAVLSTSALLLTSSDGKVSAPATVEANNVFDEIGKSSSEEGSASDIFVGYERLKCNISVESSPTAATKTHFPLPYPRTCAASCSSHRDGRNEALTPSTLQYDAYGKLCDNGTSGDQSEGFLVTISPSVFTADGRINNDIDDTHKCSRDNAQARSSVDGQKTGGRDRHKETEPAECVRSAASPLTAPSPPRWLSASTLSDIAPIPLLVFDVETFFALGELDERFAFQGGIAEWMSRATSSDSDNMFCGHTIRGRHSESRKTMGGAGNNEHATGTPDSGRPTRHVHNPLWGRHFVASRRDGEATEDKWNKLPATNSEALIQADADLFFLPLLLAQPSPEASKHDGASPTGRCLAFSSEWMGRFPDSLLVRDALKRQTRFPVAVVVVVHDDISLMRATLEEVATVVEHILVVVSLRPWHGDTEDVSSTLNMLKGILGDVHSPTYGKLRVEVGSWATESAQREHGNALIREDPRGFFRVVVMDTDEFWHPVQLAKALVHIAQHPKVALSHAGMNTYWASVRSVVSPPEKLLALWLVDPRRCFWHQNREITCRVEVGEEHDVSFDIETSTAVVHHLSYVRVEGDLKRKMNTFSHAGEEQSEWYERSWRGWAANNSLTDLHPVEATAFKRVVPQPLFRLTPALRTLHLDAKKGRATAISHKAGKGKKIFAVTRAMLTSALTGNSDSDGRAMVQNCLRGSALEQKEPISRGGGASHSRECLEEQKGCTQCAWDRCDCNCAREPGNADDDREMPEYGGDGCEEVGVEEWSEWQRTMCLVPDS
ncbi:unnamed protein product [Scytosiphon promiscuus]